MATSAVVKPQAAVPLTDNMSEFADILPVLHEEVSDGSTLYAYTMDKLNSDFDCI